MSNPEIEIEKVTVTSTGKKLEGWTVEPIQELTSECGADIIEMFQPEFYKHVCEVLGHDCWSHVIQGQKEYIMVGDIMFGEPEDLIEYYPIVDDQIKQPPIIKQACDDIE
jgi:hypothetical protein